MIKFVNSHYLSECRRNFSIYRLKALLLLTNQCGFVLRSNYFQQDMITSTRVVNWIRRQGTWITSSKETELGKIFKNRSKQRSDKIFFWMFKLYLVIIIRINDSILPCVFVHFFEWREINGVNIWSRNVIQSDWS